MFARLLLLSLCILHALSQSDFFHSGLEKRGRYCGKDLADALSLLCNGVYNSPFKKSLPDVDNSAGYWLPTYEEPPRFPFRTRASATQLIPGIVRRESPGVYYECCVKSCTLQEMSSYCGKR